MRSYSKTPLNLYTTALSTLSPDGKLLGIYLRTNQHTTMIGLYYLPRVLISHETGLSPASVEKQLAALSAAQYAFYCDTTSHVYIPGMAATEIGELKHGDNRLKHIHKLYLSVPPGPLLLLFHQDYSIHYRLPPPPEGRIPSQESESDDSANTKPAVMQARTSPIPDAIVDNTDLQTLIQRYTEPQLEKIREVVRLLKLTRKGGKIADTVLCKIMQLWDTMDVERVMYGIDKYIDKSLHLEGKAENYLTAIMRNAKPAELQQGNGRVHCSTKQSDVTTHNMAVFRDYLDKMEVEA